MSPSSFMSEHTAEYVLVNNIVGRLSPTFPNIIPLFFWMTREGNNTAIASMHGLHLRLVVCFARRPKVDWAAPNCLLMKINSELIDYRKACAPHNIPVLAGVPMIKSLSSLRLHSTCNWFDLASFDSVRREVYVEVDSNGASTLGNSGLRIATPLTNSDFEELIRRSPLMTWDHAVECLRHARRTVRDLSINSYGYAPFPFGGGYKPFLLLVVENDQLQNRTTEFPMTDEESDRA